VSLIYREARMSFEEHAYERIAADLRRSILTGELAPGDRVPSRAKICDKYQVSESVALHAVRILRAEGLVEGRSGSGTYVRLRPALSRVPRTPRTELGAGSPWRSSMAALGKDGTWSCTSRTTVAPAGVAEVLDIAEGDPVMRTAYVFSADGQAVQLSTSYEPLAITGGQPIMLPEEGPLAGRGVVERMAAIGVVVARVSENVGARPATVEEATALGEPAGATLITIERTYFDADDRPVETATILIPASRYTAEYQYRIRPAE